MLNTACSPALKAASPADRPAGSPALKSAGSPRAAVPAAPLSAEEETARLKEQIQAKAAAAAAAKKAKASEEGKVPPKSAIPEKEDTLTYELKHMVAFDITPLHPKSDMLAVSRDNVQLLVNRLFRLPMENCEEGMRIQLPELEEAFRIPREKPLPKVRAKTRWEQFAEKKGIVKQKRSKLVFDEESGDWRPRWGFKSVKHEGDQRMGIIPAKAGEDPNANPFEARSNEKQLLKAKQKMREIRNKVEAAGGRMKAGAPDLGLMKSEGTKRKGGLPQAGKRGKDGLKEALKSAQIATGSYGKFDRKAPNEATNVQPKRKKLSPPMSGEDERKKYIKTVGRVLESATISDSRAKKFVDTEEQAGNAARKAGGKGGGKGAQRPKGKRSKQGRKR